MEKQQCNLFEAVEGFDVFEVTVEESESTYDNNDRVVERIITIKAERKNRGDDKTKKITAACITATVAFVGLLADIPNAVDFVKHLLL